ncbi:MAG: hypothetical protein V5A38_13905 [Halolamina sp.]|uniref:hypothetical protein n=1 Tax=Halolamina sp. TaxID=1940283 RepID=UPI002FC31B34
MLAALPLVLAGCGRSLRTNVVPGGLYLEDRRQQAVTVTVRLRIDDGGITAEATTVD